MARSWMHPNFSTHHVARFPLYSAGVDRDHFRRALHLLNCNIHDVWKKWRTLSGPPCLLLVLELFAFDTHAYLVPPRKPHARKCNMHAEHAPSCLRDW